MSASPIPTRPSSGADMHHPLLLDSVYELTDGTLVEPTPALLAYLQALADNGIRYTRDTAARNLLAFSYQADHGTSWITRRVVQYPQFDDLHAPHGEPHVTYHLAHFAGAWPSLNCLVSSGGSLDIWPPRVAELVDDGAHHCVVDLVNGGVTAFTEEEVATGIVHRDPPGVDEYQGTGGH